MYMKPDVAYKVTKGNTEGSINVYDIIYVDKEDGSIVVPIKAAAPELLDGNTADIMDWIDNAFAMYAEDEDIVIKIDDAIREQEEYFGVEIDYMSRAQLLTVVAKLMDVTEGE